MPIWEFFDPLLELFQGFVQYYDFLIVVCNRCIQSFDLKGGVHIDLPSINVCLGKLVNLNF